MVTDTSWIQASGACPSGSESRPLLKALPHAIPAIPVPWLAEVLCKHGR
jgi:hypothetical protein